MKDIVSSDPFSKFREVTRARIGVGRTGDSMPLKAVLDFQLDHARARDAVHGSVDFSGLEKQLSPFSCLHLHSKATDRRTYLSRPDLGRQLDSSHLKEIPEGPFDLAFVIADGLSALAIERHAEPVLKECLALLNDYSIAPIILGEQARVAFGDEVGEALGAEIIVVLIGERPGLTTPGSLGAYITYAPKKGLLDSERNCISNIHDDGLSHQEAARKIAWIVREAKKLKLSGVNLKENAENESAQIVDVKTTSTPLPSEPE